MIRKMQHRSRIPGPGHHGCVLTTDRSLQSVSLRRLTQTMDKRRGYARDVTTVRHGSPIHPVSCGVLRNGTKSQPLTTEIGPTAGCRIGFLIQITYTNVCVFSVAVVSAKKKTYFELFCVPVFPMSSKHVWVCGICQWRVPLQQGCVLTILSCIILQSYLVSNFFL